MKYEIFKEGDKVFVNSSIQKEGVVIKVETNNAKYMPMSAQIVTVEHDYAMDGVYYSEIIQKFK